MGPWVEFTQKKNATAVQKQLVPWLIAKFGLAFAKSVKLPMVKEMLLALCPDLPFVTFDGYGGRVSLWFYKYCVERQDYSRYIRVHTSLCDSVL